MPRIRHFSRLNYNFTRAVFELLTEGTLSRVEWRQVLVHFCQRCAYCGIVDTGNPRTGLVADHLVPAIEHGELVLGNAVPACHDCNDLRGKTNWRVFLQGTFPAEAQQRIEQIETYLARFPYQPPLDPTSRLAPDELVEYRAILADWDSILARARKLRDLIKNRRRNLG